MLDELSLYCLTLPNFLKLLRNGISEPWARIHKRLKVETFVSSFCPKTAKTFLLGLVVFTKNLRPVLGLAKGSALRLVGSGLKFCKGDLNMAAINFSPLQNVQWLQIKYNYTEHLTKAVLIWEVYMG